MGRIVKINKDGFVESPYVRDATDIIEVSEETKEMLSTFPLDHNWRYINGDFKLEPLLRESNLRSLREEQCFNIVDRRSPMWYANLSEDRRHELESWYQAWLNVTETKVIPVKPEWL